MVKLEFTRVGQTVYGKLEANLEGRKFRPQYTVTAVDAEKGIVSVKNGRGEARMVEARDLFTQAGIEKYWKGKYFRLLNSLKDTLNSATPELREALNTEIENRQ